MTGMVEDEGARNDKGDGRSVSADFADWGERGDANCPEVKGEEERV